MRRSTGEIAEDPLHDLPMDVCRVVHELQEAVDSVGDIQTCKSQILEAAENNPAFDWVSKYCP